MEDEAGSDVELTCDVGGYPIKFEWHDEQDAVIGIASRSRKCNWIHRIPAILRPEIHDTRLA